MGINQKKKISKIKKIFLIVFLLFFILIFTICGIFYGIFFNEVNAFLSIKDINKNIYSMTYKNDYFFDEFLKTGATSDAELKNFIIKKLLHGVPVDIELPDYGCSSFSGETENGEVIFARNLDIDFAPIMVVKTYPKNSYASISMVNLSALGFEYSNLPKNLVNKLTLLASPYIPFDGMNEKGVAICVNMVNGSSIQQNTEKIDITTTTLIRLVLDKASDVDEAVNLIKKYDLHDSSGGPFHFQIVDKSGKSVVVEYYNNNIQVIDSEQNFQALTNHTLNTLETTTSNFTDTHSRLDYIKNKLLETNGVISVQGAFDILQEVKLSWGKYENGNAGGALYSAVYNLKKLELQFVYRSNLNHIYKFKI